MPIINSKILYIMQRKTLKNLKTKTKSVLSNVSASWLYKNVIQLTQKPASIPQDRFTIVDQQ